MTGAWRYFLIKHPLLYVYITMDQSLFLCSNADGHSFFSGAYDHILLLLRLHLIALGRQASGILSFQLIFGNVF